MEKEREKTIAILYSDARREYFSSVEQYITEAEVLERAKIIAPYFEKIGFYANLLPGNNDLPDELKRLKPNLVLNLVDSVYGQEHLAAIIPATLDLFNLPYIGTGMLG